MGTWNELSLAIFFIKEEDDERQFVPGTHEPMNP
jgi:hypothetical protein